MRSKTKFHISEAVLSAITENAGFGAAENMRPLGAGEFNAVYEFTAGGRDMVIKIAPAEGAPILAYEKDMMQSEIFWYGKLKAQTDIKTPEIYYSDFSGKLIPTGYFIMEKVVGQTADVFEFADGEKSAIAAKIAAKMHGIKNDKFGYIQQEQFPDWYSALRAMTASIVADGAAKGKRIKAGERLLGYIDKYRDVLMQAECCMVSFELWDPNLICRREGEDVSVTLIDPERSFWGDRMADLVCFNFMEMKSLDDKRAAIDAYNAVSPAPIEINRYTEIRYAVALGYLGVLMGTERFYRYSLHNFGRIRNLIASKMLTGAAFKLLDK